MRLKTKKSIIAFFLVLMMLIPIGCSPSTEPEPVDEVENGEPAPEVRDIRVSLATGGTAGTYYPIGAAIGQIINNNVEGVNISVESTGASVANMRMLVDGEVDFIMAASNTAYGGFVGEDPFEGEPVETMRAITGLYPEVFQFITKKDSGLTNIKDIVGKKVVVGAPGSGTERTVRLILEAHGITYDDIQPEFLSFGEGVTALQDNLTDVAVVGSGYPTAAVVDAAASMDITLLSLDTPEFASFLEEHTYFYGVTIPGGTYQGVDEDIYTGASPALLITSEDMDEDVVYDMLAGIMENLNIIEDAHVQGQFINLENAVQGVSLPWHPGAERYFKEQGAL